MPYQIKFSKDASKVYKKLDNVMRARIDQKLNYLKHTPRGHDTKKLVGMENLYRTKVGDFRLVYEIYDTELIVWVVDLGARGGIYK